MPRRKKELPGIDIHSPGFGGCTDGENQPGQRWLGRISGSDRHRGLCRDCCPFRLAHLRCSQSQACSRKARQRFKGQV